MMPPPVPATAPNYSESIDFHELVQLDGEFKRLLVANAGRMDWKNPEHVMQLTKCLLKRDFALSIELPEDRLCPPV
jgi:23S rRNA (adenine1618-N6)-methyltransferase